MKLKPAGYLPICIKSDYKNEVGLTWHSAYGRTLRMAKLAASDFGLFDNRKFRYIPVYAKVSDLKHKTSRK